MIRASTIGDTYYLDVRANGEFIARSRGSDKTLVQKEVYALVKAWADTQVLVASGGKTNIEDLLQASVEAKRNG